MAVRKKLKKRVVKNVKSKKQVQPTIKKSLDKPSINSVAASKITTTRKRKAEAVVLNGDGTLNGKRCSKRARNTLVHSKDSKTNSIKEETKILKSKAKSSNHSSKIAKNSTANKKLKVPAAKSSKHSSKIVMNSTADKKLKVPAKLRESKTKLKKKPTPRAQPKKKSEPKKKSSKALIPRDFVTEYIKEPTFETRESIPHVSTIAHSRLLIRAINLNDMKMLKSLINEKTSICSFKIPRSLNINRDALSYAFEKQNMEAIKILLDNKLSTNLASFPDILLADEGSGHNSTMMFGHALRNVTVGREEKEPPFYIFV